MEAWDHLLDTPYVGGQTRTVQTKISPSNCHPHGRIGPSITRHHGFINAISMIC
jgi:hypothetical protein